MRTLMPGVKWQWRVEKKAAAAATACTLTLQCNGHNGQCKNYHITVQGLLIADIYLLHYLVMAVTQHCNKQWNNHTSCNRIFVSMQCTKLRTCCLSGHSDSHIRPILTTDGVFNTDRTISALHPHFPCSIKAHNSLRLKCQCAQWHQFILTGWQDSLVVSTLDQWTRGHGLESRWLRAVT